MSSRRRTRRRSDRSAGSGGPGRRLVWFVVLALAAGLLAYVQRERSGDDPDPPRAPTPIAEGRDDNSGVIGLFVQPEDKRAPILDELTTARLTIDLEVYLLSDPEIIAALEDAVSRGVRVRVILEEDPFGGSGDHEEVFARLDAAGIEVRWDNGTFRFNHIKAFVIDNRVAIVMNQNLTRSSFDKNRELGVVTTRRADVAHAAAIFAADWTGGAEPADGPLIVSPTDSRTELLGLITGATRSLDVYAEVVRDEQIVAALEDAESRGVAVRLVVSADSAENDRGRDEREQLTDSGAEVRLARGGLYIHAKMLLVDGQRAYVGSQNFTATSLDQNRELGIILDDPASIERMSATFAGDFADGRVG